MNIETAWPYICTSAGVSIFILGILIRIKLKASESWPQVVGIILESTIQPGWSKVGGESIYVVRPRVVYRYEVAGKSYQSSRLALIESNSANAEVARQKAQSYSVGEKVVVFYNPRKPDFATLQIGDPTKGLFPIGLTIVGIIVAIGGVVWILRILK